MAWCAHCKQDRPIQRQTYDEKCPFCMLGFKFKDLLGNNINFLEHKSWCRGPVVGALDVCTFCNTPVFAKAITKDDYDKMLDNETKGREEEEHKLKATKSSCFVVTATMGHAEHPIVYDMRRFKDEILESNSIGRTFIEWYYKYGPKIAKKIEGKFFQRLTCYIFVIIPAYLIAKFLLAFYDLFHN